MAAAQPSSTGHAAGRPATDSTRRPGLCAGTRAPQLSRLRAHAPAAEVRVTAFTREARLRKGTRVLGYTAALHPALDTLTKLVNSPGGVLTAGAVLAGIVWKFFERIEAVLTEQTKYEIAVWLAGV